MKYVLSGRTLLDYASLFSPNDYKKNKKIIYICILRTNMSSLKFRLKKVDETRNNLLEEIKHDDLTSEKHKNTCKYLNYVEHLLILASIVTGCFSIPAFASLVCVLVDITSSEVGLIISAVTAGINNYKSIIKKKNKNHDEIVLLGKPKFDTTELLISRVLIDSCISHEEIPLVNNVLREYNEMKEKLKNHVKYIIQKQWKPITSVVRKILQEKIPVLKRTEQNRLMLFQIVLFVARKNRLSLKIKNSTILILFQIIILK